VHDVEEPALAVRRIEDHELRPGASDAAICTSSKSSSSKAVCPACSGAASSTRTSDTTTGTGAPSRSKSARKIHRVERTAELDDADALTAPGAFRKGVELADRARVERRHGGGRRGRGRIAGDGGRGGDCRRRSARPRLEAESAVHERRDRRGQPQGAGRLRRVRPSATQSSEHAVPNAAAIAPIGPRIVSERQCRSTTSMPRCAQ